MRQKKFFIFLVVFSIILALVLKNSKKTSPALLSLPTPTPTPFTTYQIPKLPSKTVYKITLVGDSMTHALGPHGGRLLDWLQTKFKPKGFIITNYAYSTNIESMPKFLNQPTQTWGETFPPILTSDADVIIIESFGYNPLSADTLEGGLKRQTEILNQTTQTLIRAKPQTIIVFMTTIAPNRTHYGLKTIQLTQTSRDAEVSERIAYIKNHIAFAESHNIPLVNVFEKSLTPDGDGNLQYISPDDYIHPSVDGIELISERITNTLYYQTLIPHD